MGCCCSRSSSKRRRKGSHPNSGESGQNLDGSSKEKAPRSPSDSSTPSTNTTPIGGPLGSPSPSPGDKKAVYYVALWDHTAETKAELSIKCGDRLRLMDEAGEDAGPDWIFVTRAGDKCGTGYAPRAFVGEENTIQAELLYFGPLSRQEAEDLLRDASEGAFLVRNREPSSTKRQTKGPADQAYTLTVKRNGQVKHHPIWLLNDKYGGGYFLSKKRKFGSLIDLLEWYKRDPNTEDMGLIQPLLKKKPKPVPLPADAQNQWREIPRSQIAVGNQVGKGNFGVVYEGTWNQPSGPPKKVAIKALKKGSAAGALYQFIKEAMVMKSLCHKHLVQLYGVVSTEEPFWMVQEFVKDGSLLKYLQARKQRNDELPEKTLAHVCLQIASGMHYLEEKHIVHRDLAARNVLVEADGSNSRIFVKIADFGLAKLIIGEPESHGRKRVKDIPTKWTAPEALDKGLYSSKSDVWSFGIVIHEVFTHGKEPYEMFSNVFVRRLVIQNREILRRDMRVPEKAYEIMKKCFSYVPSQRPTFKELYDIFNSYFGDSLLECVSPPSAGNRSRSRSHQPASPHSKKSRILDPVARG